MIEITLNNSHLGCVFVADDGSKGKLKAYHNVNRTAFIVVDGVIKKYPYEQLKLNND